MEQTELIQIGGAGPAGLAAAITLAKAGRCVLIHEAQGEVGHRFDGDFQWLENWSTQQDVLDLLRETGITTEFAMIPLRPWLCFRRLWQAPRGGGPQDAFLHGGTGTGFRVWMCIVSSMTSASRG